MKYLCTNCSPFVAVCINGDSVSLVIPRERIVGAKWKLSGHNPAFDTHYNPEKVSCVWLALDNGDTPQIVGFSERDIVARFDTSNDAACQ